MRQLADSAWRRYSKTLRSYLLRRLASRPADVDDIVQEVYKRLLATDPATPIHNPRNYLYGIAKNVLKKLLRDGKRDKQHIDFTPDPLEKHERPCDNPMADESAERLIHLQQLRNALEALPPKLAEALWLVKGEGLTYEEAARRMSIPVRTLDGYLCEAKARIAMQARNL